MSPQRLLPAAAILAAGAALAAPLLLADDKPDHPKSRFTDARTADQFKDPPGQLGWGKGSIMMPVGERTGMLVGVLTECDGPCKFMLEGELSGFMPSTGLSGGAEYWFGGIYGVMREVTGGPAPDREHARVLQVEGMWVLDKNYQGSLSAQILTVNEAGNPYVCGLIDGQFKVSEAMPGPEPGPSGSMTGKVFTDEASAHGAKLQVSDRASEGGTIVCPKGKDLYDGVATDVKGLRVAGTPPAPGAAAPAGYDYLPDLQDAGDARPSKTGGQYEKDFPCTAGWRDVKSTVPPYGTPETPAWPVLMGSFDLRYQLYE